MYAGLFNLTLTLPPSCCASRADLAVKAEPGDAAVPVSVIPAAAPGPVQPGARAPPAAAGRAPDRAPAEATPPAGDPLLRSAGPGAHPPARPQGTLHPTVKLERGGCGW